MAYTVLIHILNEEPIVGEIEELPTSTDTNIKNIPSSGGRGGT